MKLFSAINRQMFPGGKDDEKHQVTKIFNIFSCKYEIKDINNTLRFVLSCLLFSENKNETEVVNLAFKRPNNIFTQDEIGKIVDFAIQNNVLLRLKFTNNK